MSKYVWSTLHSQEHYKVARTFNDVHGWVVLIDGWWIARTSDGAIRAEFKTEQEATDFMNLILTTKGNDDVSLP
jgi:hypothetical protein